MYLLSIITGLSEAISRQISYKWVMGNDFGRYNTINWSAEVQDFILHSSYMYLVRYVVVI